MTTERMPDPKIVLEALREALGDVLAEERVLLELGVHELSVVHRFGIYFEKRLRPQLGPNELTIDMDYNRHGNRPKRLPPRPDRPDDGVFRPDLIVHHREDDERNLLVVEWKKHADDSTLKLLDERIRSLLATDDYGYMLGVIVDSRNDSIRWRTAGRGAPDDGWNCVGSA